MSQRHLKHFMQPRSLAVIGATDRPGSVGQVLMQNLLQAGFRGSLYPVNPKHPSLLGLPCYPDIASLPEAPDCAVVATPPATVPGIITELGERGTKAAVVITAGFGEGAQGGAGHDLQKRLLRAAGAHDLRIIGPNCLGIQVPASYLNASFSRTQALPGQIAFLSQSGAMATAVVDWAASRGIGFSHVISLGDMADVDFGDLLDLFTADPSARAILLYVEAVTLPRKFMSAARAAARVKPVIVVKAGRFAEGAKAATTHTGALAGSDKVYSTAFHRAGLLRVYELNELFEAVETLSKISVPSGERLAILTNGGGAGVLATDALIAQGGKLASLSEKTLVRLDEILPSTWSRANPVDIIGDADAERYVRSLEVLLKDEGVDAVLTLNCPTAIVDSGEVARRLIQVKASKSHLAVWMGGEAAQPSRRLFAEAGLPSYGTPESGVRAFMHLVRYRRSQQALLATPPSLPEEFSPDKDKAREILHAALERGDEWLGEHAAKELLRTYAIATTRTWIARTPSEVAARAAEAGGPVVVKIHSPDITHKSDVGGVALGLDSPEEAQSAAASMLEKIRAAKPEARHEGFIVEDMIRTRGAFELIVGMNEDAQFGPVLMFGEGGTAVEVIDDTTLELPPLDLKLARAMIERTRVFRRLRGFRDQPPVALDQIALTLMKISQLVVDFSEIASIDINPLIADSEKVLALDARVKLQPAQKSTTARLAIKPYPKELESTLRLPDGREFFVRPIRGEDEPALLRAFANLTPTEVRRRFSVSSATIGHLVAARFAQINYDREMALVVTDGKPAGQAEIGGIAGLITDPDGEKADYAVIVREEFSGQGLGRLLMEKLISYARSRGLRELNGQVLKENIGMLNLARELGFEIIDEGSADSVRTNMRWPRVETK